MQRSMSKMRLELDKVERERNEIRRRELANEDFIFFNGDTLSTAEKYVPKIKSGAVRPMSAAVFSPKRQGRNGEGEFKT